MERVQAGLRIPYDLNAWLTQEAQKQGIAKNAFILQILWDYAEYRRGKVNNIHKEATPFLGEHEDEREPEQTDAGARNGSGKS